MKRDFVFTSESVAEGHPDKLADRISDSVLDWLLARDAEAHVACEVLLAKNLIVVAGEFRSRRLSNLLAALGTVIPDIARNTVREIGYRGDATGFDPDGCEVKLSISAQSENIDAGVTRGQGVIGAGDQGLMFGYACDETPELMPLPIMLAHALMRQQSSVRRSGALPWLRPDGKSQVSMRYHGGKPIAVESIVVSTQHAPEADDRTVQREVLAKIIEPVVPPELRAPAMRVLVNPAGRFEIGGPLGDTGLTGRKNIVDTYGGACPHGGGALSGKDPTKVDRSAAYAARYVAKNVVGAGLARRCTVQVAYAIGLAEPVSLFVDTHGTAAVEEAAIERAVREVFDLTPAGIIHDLDLRRPIYARAAAYGHFGRHEIEFTWERTDRVDALKAAVTKR